MPPKRPTPLMSSAPKATPPLQVLDTPELLAIILCFLKEHCVSQTPTNAGGKPMWKRKMVHLATINSSFFRATIDLLWEEVDSLQPFLAMVNPSYASKAPTERDDGIGRGAWTRFELYASRVKVLTLDSYDFYPCWAMYVAMSPQRPLPLFPALRELTFASGESMSLLVAMDSRPTVQTLRIALSQENEAPDAYEATAALTASLVEDARQLTSMDLEHPVDMGIIRNVSKISSLRNLTVHIRTGGAAAITPLLKLASLQSLNLKIDSFEGDREHGTLWRGALSRMMTARTHPNLQDLTIAASTDTQIAAAKVLGPVSLKSLQLTVCYSGSAQHSSQALSLVLTAYIGRNPGLTSLVVGSICSFKHPQGPSQTTEITFDWSPEFCSRLSGLRELERLDLTGILLPTPDFIRRVFGTLPNFSRLRKFRFTPHSASSHVEPWVLPNLGDLTQIPIHNPLLASLAMPIDSRSFIPPAPPVGSQSIKYLSLAFHPILRSQMTHDSALSVSLFLDQLFPCIRSLTSNFAPASPHKTAWKPVKQMVEAYQLVRARAMQNAGLFSSP